LIATARYQAAATRATQTKPYTEGITNLVEQLSRGVGDIPHPLLEVREETRRVAYIVITSNRGLCGAYNGLIVREAEARMTEAEAAGVHVDLTVTGKKGIAYYRFRGREMVRAETCFEDKPQFAEVEPIAADLIDAYEGKEIDGAYVTYTKYISTSRQEGETLQLLPIERPGGDEGGDGDIDSGIMYDFSPPAEQLLEDLLPDTVKVRLYQCFTDAAVSEQVSRMVAMKAATDAADDMLKTLSNYYNRARQTQITLELLDIVSGAEALR
jgi:F-type H+-transporting ATPase subunit gamma